jgi:hypothetical protein
MVGNRYTPFALQPSAPVTHVPITVAPVPGADVRVRELEDQLRRERSARVGVERGLQALSERVTVLQRENRELRAQLGLPPV